jgi:uncharacterized Zn finger protein (UPF0148 family)
LENLMRNRRVLALSLVVALAVVTIPAAAFALPGDPPIESLGPADGASLVAGETGSVHVTFKCPAYRIEAGETDAESKERERKEEEKGQKPNPAAKRDGMMGGETDYKVRFSSSSDRGADGLLTANLGSGFATAEADKTICGSDFEAPVPVRPTALYQGTVYWQVVREVKRNGCPTCATETPKEREEREDKEAEEEEKEFEDEEKGIVVQPKGEWEGGPVRSFSLQPKVEEPMLTTQTRVFAGYTTAIEFSSVSDLTGATIELQRFTKGVWKPLAQVPVSEATNFFVKLPAGHIVLRPVAKTPSVTLPLESRKVTVHKLGKHRLTSAEEDGRYREKPTKKSKAGGKQPRLPLSFAVVDGGTRVVHLRASVEGVCTTTGRSGEEVPLTIKTALRAARIAPDGTVIAERKTKEAEPQRVTFVGQLLDGSLIGTVTTSFGNCSGSRKFEAVPLGSR